MGKSEKKSLDRGLSFGTLFSSNGHHQGQFPPVQSLTRYMENDKSNHGNSVFWSLLVSDSQTSQDSSGSQIEEPTGPGATSKFLQKWQIDFEPLFTPFLSIAHQNQPHSDLRHTLKYRFLKFWLKTVKSSYVFDRFAQLWLSVFSREFSI